MEPRRVAVTGMGILCAAGRNKTDFWQSMTEGRSGIGPLDVPNCPPLRFQNAAQVRDIDPAACLGAQRARFLDRFAQFGLLAAREAIEDAHVEWTEKLKARSCIVTGTGGYGHTSLDQCSEDLYGKRRDRVDPLTIPRGMANAAASHISMEFGITGPAYSISTACASANHALGQAFWMIRQGIADLAVAGGCEAPLSPVMLKAWEALRVVASDTCRPFSKDRRGMILGEGGAMLVLEPLDAARSRGAHIYGEIIGFGMSADAHHLTQPSAEGAGRAINAALLDAGVEPQQIEYINAHGTGTLVNDEMETNAIRSIFGEHANRLAVSSTKSMHGHALGASGAFEAIATLLAMQEGILPPTANFSELDPACDLDVIPNQARRADVEYALSNSFAFGGLNAVLAFRRWLG